ncbi:Wzz/FepE/Etk N-terminal domain-containing protein [Eoetvoesiella caeni]
MEQNLSPDHQLNEIDLCELASTLWSSKLLILLTTLLVTGLAAAYAVFSTPVYETVVRVLPPTPGNLASYNLSSQLTSNSILSRAAARSHANAASAGISVLTVKEAYEAFLQRLTSDSVRQAFFEKIYLPAHGGPQAEISEQSLWKRLNQEIKIKLPTKPSKPAVEITVEGQNPDTIAKWANEYM